VIGNGIPTIEWHTPIIPLIGSIEMGRFLNDDEWVQGNEIGAHTLGFNSTSLGICLIHQTKFYAAQFDKLFELCDFLGEHFNIPLSHYYGHYEKDKGKPLCPGFDMGLFRDALAGPEGKKDFMQYLSMNDKVVREWNG
jgi:hypothetical protein